MPDDTPPPARPGGIDCTTAMRRLYAFLDGALPAGEASAVETHVAECAECRAHTEFERELLASIRGVRERHDDVDGLRDAVLRVLHGAGLA